MLLQVAEYVPALAQPWIYNSSPTITNARTDTSASPWMSWYSSIFEGFWRTRTEICASRTAKKAVEIELYHELGSHLANLTCMGLPSPEIIVLSEDEGQSLQKPHVWSSTERRSFMWSEIAVEIYDLMEGDWVWPQFCQGDATPSGCAVGGHDGSPRYSGVVIVNTNEHRGRVGNSYRPEKLRAGVELNMTCRIQITFLRPGTTPEPPPRPQARLCRAHWSFIFLRTECCIIGVIAFLIQFFDKMDLKAQCPTSISKMPRRKQVIGEGLNTGAFLLGHMDGNEGSIRTFSCLIFEIPIKIFSKHYMPLMAFCGSSRIRVSDVSNVEASALTFSPILHAIRVNMVFPQPLMGMTSNQELRSSHIFVGPDVTETTSYTVLVSPPSNPHPSISHISLPRYYELFPYLTASS
ncbi:uncharacterized protein BDR25DRAFT_363501 [Lindgomyces ingoldianus]|uniref:Uncharacterized protein n=1 Tax=Lindgomyces ingoldianus TaxID=673940 RepID=A0ACB6Q7K0_9PLEO|nr:uncharacterized protein BDR25DRAFT_363501 [Lindgomyces ingoldianus]KAF2462843.1 hypothetical protein BDR25DRAFT_363501 [Lindgomyces ingoldianus]